MSGENYSSGEKSEMAQSTQTEYTEFDPAAAQKNIEEAERRKKRRIAGAKVLTAAGFAGRHQEIVDSSFQRALQTKQKLVGNNGDRRSDAYITRVEGIVEKYGDKAEKRLWEISSASSALVVDPENVPDSYWETQAQIRRDNGVSEYISDYEKELLVEDAQKRQRESIKSWSDYLSQEDCPYPMWFKLFAWDGATKMSAVYDGESQRFVKRDETTMAPYPHLNPAVLGQVYGTICKVNGLDESSEMEESSLDEATEKIARTYNFNKLYSLFLSRQQVTPEVPKNPEDVQGDWVEYKPGEEEALAKAAVGTPWCVASPAVGKNYLTRGQYGTDEVKKSGSKAKFILFHLRNGDTGELASSACASIRLGPDGNVAEISGVRTGQMLDDALLPEVEKKVKSLPGGKKYLEAFADKRKLIRIDKKMRAGEELTDDELRFAYELDRPIQKIEQYGDDTRAAEAKQKYPLSALIKRKVVNAGDIKKLIQSEYIVDITLLIDVGASINDIIEDGHYGLQDIDELLKREIPHEEIAGIVSKQDGSWVFRNFDYLTSRGFTAKELTKKMPASALLSHLDFLDGNNVPYNLRKIIREAIRGWDYNVILDNSKAIMERGGKINFKKIAKRMGPQEIIYHADAFCDNGYSDKVKEAIMSLKKDDEGEYNFTICRNLRQLLDRGIEIADLEKIVNAPGQDVEQVLLSLDELLERGVNPKIKESEIINVFRNGSKEALDAIFKHSERFDFKAISEKMTTWRSLIECFDELIENGAVIDVEKLAMEAPPVHRLLNKEKFEKHGVNINVDAEISKLSGGDASYLLHHLDDNSIVRENVDKLAKIILSDEGLNEGAKNNVKPILWRLGYIQ